MPAKLQIIPDDTVGWHDWGDGPQMTAMVLYRYQRQDFGFPYIFTREAWEAEDRDDILEREALRLIRERA